MPTNIVLNPGVTMRLLQDAVAERGEDFTFYDAQKDEAVGGCQYVTDGAPCCIVGEVLNRAGMDLGWFAEGPGRNVKPLYEFGRTFANVAMDPTSYAMLAKAQSMQDQGATWGDCLDAAEALLRALNVDRNGDIA